MSITYAANFGIGYEVWFDGTEEQEQNILGGDPLLDYLECEVGDDFETFDCSDLDSDNPPVFIVLGQPFKWGLDLTTAKGKLDSEVERLGLSTEGEFKVVGGLDVY